jgi:hypothetical protein
MTKPHRFVASQEARDIEQALCDAFGFTSCSFDMDMRGDHNIFSYPISNHVTNFKDMQKYMISKNGKGIRYTRDANVMLYVYVTKGLFFYPDYTDAEVTALLLHEVGRNFFSATTQSGMVLARIRQILMLCLTPALLLPQTGFYRNFYIDIKNSIEKNLSFFVDAFSCISNFVKVVIGAFLQGQIIITNFLALINPTSVIASIPSQVASKLNLNNLINVVFMPIGYREEASSDMFVTSFGYGIELASILYKLKHNSGGHIGVQLYRDGGSFVGNYFDLLMIPSKIIINIFEPHPNACTRIKKQYDYIQRELQKGNLNPEMKKELNKELKAIGELLDAYVKLEDDGFFFSNGLDRAFLKVFNGDIRDIFSHGMEDEYDKNVERAKENYKRYAY